MLNIKKIIVSIIAIVVLIVVYWLLSPFFIDKVVNEDLEKIIVQDFQKSEKVQIDKIGEADGGIVAEPELATASIGQFVGLAGHSASGTVKIIDAKGKYYVRFEDDFESANGPDVHVYLGKNNAYDPKTDMGLIKGNIGSQNYEIPENVNIAEYNEVWIWCKAFSVAFGKAELK